MTSVRIDNSVVERFWKKVKHPGSFSVCWDWVGCKTSRGYGRMTVDYKQIHAHRVSYSIYSGEIPDGMCVCHTCDNPSCVNPFHLFLGTHADNMRDMKEKGRAIGHNGEDNPKARFQRNEIIEIRKIYDTNKYKYGLTKRLSEAYNVPKSTMSKIVNRKTWNFL